MWKRRRRRGGRGEKNIEGSLGAVFRPIWAAMTNHVWIWPTAAIFFLFRSHGRASLCARDTYHPPQCMHVHVSHDAG